MFCPINRITGVFKQKQFGLQMGYPSISKIKFFCYLKDSVFLKIAILRITHKKKMRTCEKQNFTSSTEIYYVNSHHREIESN